MARGTRTPVAPAFGRRVDVQLLTSQFALGSAAQRDDRHAQRSVTAGKACLLTS
jgi:hypothetical protein